MKVGVPTEIKADEYRVAITPAGVRELREHGHEVLVQAGAGEGSAIADADYAGQGATVVPDAADVFAEAEMIMHVKELQPEEIAMLSPGQLLFTYLHLAPDPAQTRGLCESGVTAIAYETVENARGLLPLLAPMSEVAGKIATQAGAFMLEKPLGGRGILLGGVPGVAAKGSSRGSYALNPPSPEGSWIVTARSPVRRDGGPPPRTSGPVRRAGHRGHRRGGPTGRGRRRRRA